MSRNTVFAMLAEIARVRVDLEGRKRDADENGHQDDVLESGAALNAVFNLETSLMEIARRMGEDVREG